MAGEIVGKARIKGRRGIWYVEAGTSKDVFRLRSPYTGETRLVDRANVVWIKARAA